MSACIIAAWAAREREMEMYNEKKAFSKDHNLGKRSNAESNIIKINEGQAGE